MRSIKTQKGVSIVETLITLPVLMIITMCTLEATQYIKANIIGSHVAYETARMSASWPSLIDYSQNPPEVASNPKTAIIEKIRILAERQGFTDIAFEEFVIDYSQGAAANTIEVEVPLRYTPVFDLWGKTRVRSRASVAYLFPDAP